MKKIQNKLSRPPVPVTAEVPVTSDTEQQDASNRRNDGTAQNQVNMVRNLNHKLSR